MRSIEPLLDYLPRVVDLVEYLRDMLGAVAGERALERFLADVPPDEDAARNGTV